jgi:hypothetical protein
MAFVDGTPVLQPKEWFTEEIAVELFLEEVAENIILEFDHKLQTLEKDGRLLKE